MYFATLFSAFLGPCWFYADGTNVLRHGSLNLKRKVILMLRNIFLLLVRVFAITSAIFFPVINQWQWSALMGKHGENASSMLDNPSFRLEFQKYFSEGLNALTIDIRRNAQFFGLFLVVHLLIIAASHRIFHRFMSISRFL